MLSADILLVCKVEWHLGESSICFCSHIMRVKPFSGQVEEIDYIIDLITHSHDMGKPPHITKFRSICSIM